MEEALRLAIQCRVLDMRASPYDLRALDPSVDFGAFGDGARGVCLVYVVDPRPLDS